MDAGAVHVVIVGGGLVERCQPAAGTEHPFCAGGHEGLLPPQRGSLRASVESGKGPLSGALH